MDRDERQNPPAAGRGYDPGAVDAQLRRAADELDPTPRTPPQPTARTGLQAERLEDAATGMLDKLDRLQHELDRLLSGLKSTADTLAGSLEELSRDVGTLTGPVPAAPPAPAGARSTDDAGARLVAVTMAADGAPREETARFLAEHYDLEDLERLLDDVYSSGGR